MTPEARLIELKAKLDNETITPAERVEARRLVAQMKGEEYGRPVTAETGAPIAGADDDGPPSMIHNLLRRSQKAADDFRGTYGPVADVAIPLAAQFVGGAGAGALASGLGRGARMGSRIIGEALGNVGARTGLMGQPLGEALRAGGTDVAFGELLHGATKAIPGRARATGKQALARAAAGRSGVRLTPGELGSRPGQTLESIESRSPFWSGRYAANQEAKKKLAKGRAFEELDAGRTHKEVGYAVYEAVNEGLRIMQRPYGDFWDTVTSWRVPRPRVVEEVSRAIRPRIERLLKSRKVYADEKLYGGVSKKVVNMLDDVAKSLSKRPGIPLQDRIDSARRMVGAELDATQGMLGRQSDRAVLGQVYEDLTDDMARFLDPDDLISYNEVKAAYAQSKGLEKTLKSIATGRLHPANVVTSLFSKGAADEQFEAIAALSRLTGDTTVIDKIKRRWLWDAFDSTKSFDSFVSKIEKSRGMNRELAARYFDKETDDITRAAYEWAALRDVLKSAGNEGMTPGGPFRPFFNAKNWLAMNLITPPIYRLLRAMAPRYFGTDMEPILNRILEQGLTAAKTAAGGQLSGPTMEYARERMGIPDRPAMEPLERVAQQPEFRLPPQDSRPVLQRAVENPYRSSYIPLGGAK